MRSFRPMIKAVSIVAGVALILIGLVVFPMPIPLGAIMMVCGLALLVSASARASNFLKSFRRRHRGANQVIQTVEDRLPQSWKKALRRSDP